MRNTHFSMYSFCIDCWLEVCNSILSGSGYITSSLNGTLVLLKHRKFLTCWMNSVEGKGCIRWTCVVILTLSIGHLCVRRKAEKPLKEVFFTWSALDQEVFERQWSPGTFFVDQTTAVKLRLSGLQGKRNHLSGGKEGKKHISYKKMSSLFSWEFHWKQGTNDREREMWEKYFCIYLNFLPTFVGIFICFFSTIILSTELGYQPGSLAPLLHPVMCF